MRKDNKLFCDSVVMLTERGFFLLITYSFGKIGTSETSINL